MLTPTPLLRTNPMSVELYNRLFAGEHLAIRFADRRGYESLRVALHKQHQTPRLILEITDDALCASWNGAEGIGTFWLGTARRQARKHTFEVIGDAQVRTDLAPDQASVCEQPGSVGDSNSEGREHDPDDE